MRTGMNLLLWTAHVTEEHFPLMAKLKTGRLRRRRAAAVRAATPPTTGKIRKELDNLGLGCTTVTVVQPRGQPDQPRRRPSAEGGLDRIKWAIEMTATLGGENLCGPYHSPLGVFSGTGPTDDEKARGADIAAQGGRVRPAEQGHARHRVPQPLRVLLPDHRRRRRRASSSASTTRTSA